MGASMSRLAVLAALVGVALASSLPGEEVLKGRDKHTTDTQIDYFLRAVYGS